MATKFITKNGKKIPINKEIQRLNKRIRDMKDDKRFNVKIHHEDPKPFDKEIAKVKAQKEKLLEKKNA